MKNLFKVIINSTSEKNANFESDNYEVLDNSSLSFIFGGDYGNDDDEEIEPHD